MVVFLSTFISDRFQGGRGDTGFTGSRGVTGFTGSIGNTGFSGSLGFTGSIGFSGSQGTTGFTGSQGIIGYTGSTGPIAGTDGQIIYNNGGVSGGANVWFDDTNQRLGVGTSTPSSKLQVVGTVTATDFNSTSDLTKKTDLVKIDNAIDKINKINGYTFTFKETGQKSAGVIAQELKEVLPVAVRGKKEI